MGDKIIIYLEDGHVIEVIGTQNCDIVVRDKSGSQPVCGICGEPIGEGEEAFEVPQIPDELYHEECIPRN